MTREEIARFFALSHPGSASMPIKTVKQELSLGRIEEMSRIYERSYVVKPACPLFLYRTILEH